MNRVDGRPVLLGLAAWAGAWCATLGDQRAWLVCAAGCGVILAVAAARRSAAFLAVAIVLGVSLGGGVLRVAQLSSGPVASMAREGAVVEADLVLRGGARTFAATPTRPASWSSAAIVQAVRGRGAEWVSGVPVELSASGDELEAWQSLAAGTLVRVTVKLSSADPDADSSARARARDAPQVLASPGALDAAVAHVRQGLRLACSGLPPDARALVPALVVGDTSLMNQELTSRFKTTGLTHLTAVSGANLVLLLAFIRVIAVRLGARRHVLTGVLLVTVLGFVMLCNAEPSVVRAAAMGIVALAAVGSSARGRQGVRYLSVAVLVLVLWDPWIARSLGFALSVTASAGLLWWAGAWTRIMTRWAPTWVAESVAVPLAAQLATQPIVTAISGQLSLVGILANTIAGPLVGPATVTGFLGAGIGAIWVPLASIVVWPAGACAMGLSWIARLGDALPGAVMGWPVTWYSLVLLAVLCWLLARLMPILLANRWLSFACAVALVVSLARTPTPPGWPPASWAIVSCDVGQGDATVIRAGPGQAVVVDAGPDPVLLRRCLDQLGVSAVPLVLLTHLHADHATGLPAASGRGLKTVVTSGVRTPAYGEQIVDAAAQLGAQHVTARAGDAWQVGDARVEVLAADGLADDTAAVEGESSAENNSSLVIRASVDGVSILLSGDSETDAQTRHVPLASALDVDVLLVPHHGSSRQDPAYLAAATPEIVLISVGAKNDYGHPTKKTLAVVERLSPNVVRTDQHGSIAIARTDGRMVVTTQR